MNSARSFAASSGGGDDLTYTDQTMTEQAAMDDRFSRCQQGGNSLGRSRLAMSEVQICGIPKLSKEEVAPTP
jgi:hypothetical protein